jgi:hypothetical protein
MSLADRAKAGGMSYYNASDSRGIVYLSLFRLSRRAQWPNGVPTRLRLDSSFPDEYFLFAEVIYVC